MTQIFDKFDKFDKDVPQICGQRSRAWVVFSDRADLTWLKILKPGFRHCFVMLDHGTDYPSPAGTRQWTSIDPLCQKLDITTYTISNDFDIPQWLADQGYIIYPIDHVAGEGRNSPRKSQWGLPLRILSCVEITKQILGIKAWYVCTPWQLFRYLNRHIRPHKYPCNDIGSHIDSHIDSGDPQTAHIM